MLIVDSNEYSNHKNKIDKAFKDVEFRVEPLKAGDFFYEDMNIVIERKSISDYITSIKNNHLFSQAVTMSVFEHKYLFVSGSLSEYNRKCHSQHKHSYFSVDQMIGTLCSLSAHYNLKILQFDNDTQLLKAILKIREKTEKAGEISGEIERTTFHKNPTVRNYMSLPGMGKIKAEKLADIYPDFIDFYAEIKEKGIENMNIPKSLINKVTKEVFNR